MRHLIGLALMALLVACSSGGANNNQQLLAAAKAQFFGKKGTTASPTREQVRAGITPDFRQQTGNVPLLLASSLRVPITSILPRLAVNGDVETYMSSDGISVSFRDGLLIGTRGLGNDLMAADVSGVAARIRAGSGQAVRTHKYLNGEEQLVPYRFDCTYARSGAEVVESCSGEGLSFTNRYVTTKGGGFAVSTQWASPRLQSYLFERIR